MYENKVSNSRSATASNLRKETQYCNVHSLQEFFSSALVSETSGTVLQDLLHPRHQSIAARELIIRAQYGMCGPSLDAKKLGISLSQTTVLTSRGSYGLSFFLVSLILIPSCLIPSVRSWSDVPALKNMQIQHYSDFSHNHAVYDNVKGGCSLLH